MADDIRTVPSPERGCGHLKEGKAYLRSNVSPDGVLPPFVEFEQPTTWLEGQLRGYSHFPGMQFELAVTPQPVDYRLGAESHTRAAVEAVANMPTAVRDAPDDLDELRAAEVSGDGLRPGNWKTREDPPLEAHRHVARLAEDTERSHQGTHGTHVGELRVARANDLLMWVGETYYPTPGAFIEECQTKGLSKAIPTGKNQAPPVINPGRTRVFVIHPRAVPISSNPVGDDGEDGYRPGIIGYAYVTDVIYTGQSTNGDVEFPEWAQEYADADRMELVEIGERIPEEAQNTAALADFVDAGIDPREGEP